MLSENKKLSIGQPRNSLNGPLDGKMLLEVIRTRDTFLKYCKSPTSYQRTIESPSKLPI